MIIIGHALGCHKDSLPKREHILTSTGKAEGNRHQAKLACKINLACEATTDCGFQIVI